VWIVDTPTNKSVAQRLWKARPAEDHLTGVTTFNDLKSFSPEEMLVAELNTIDLHYGSDSADSRYTIIEVLGTPLTAKTKNDLSACGFNEFHANSAAFTAKRPEPLA
jgi:hypothetical protein